MLYADFAAHFYVLCCGVAKEKNGSGVQDQERYMQLWVKSSIVLAQCSLCICHTLVIVPEETFSSPFHEIIKIKGIQEEKKKKSAHLHGKKNQENFVCLFVLIVGLFALNTILSKLHTRKSMKMEFRVSKRLRTNILISLGLSFFIYRVQHLVVLAGL